MLKKNEFYANVVTMTALKATKLADRNTISTFLTHRDLIRANLIATPVQIKLRYLHFSPLSPAMCTRLLRVCLQIKLRVVTKLTTKS